MVTAFAEVVLVTTANIVDDVVESVEVVKTISKVVVAVESTTFADITPPVEIVDIVVADVVVKFVDNEGLASDIDVKQVAVVVEVTGGVVEAAGSVG